MERIFYTFGPKKKIHKSKKKVFGHIPVPAIVFSQSENVNLHVKTEQGAKKTESVMKEQANGDLLDKKEDNVISEDSNQTGASKIESKKELQMDDSKPMNNYVQTQVKTELLGAKKQRKPLGTRNGLIGSDTKTKIYKTNVLAKEMDTLNSSEPSEKSESFHSEKSKTFINTKKSKTFEREQPETFDKDESVLKKEKTSDIDIKKTNGSLDTKSKNVKPNPKTVTKARQKLIKGLRGANKPREKYAPNDYQVLHAGEFIVRVLKGDVKEAKKNIEPRTTRKNNKSVNKLDKGAVSDMKTTKECEDSKNKPVKTEKDLKDSIGSKNEMKKEETVDDKTPAIVNEIDKKPEVDVVTNPVLRRKSKGALPTLTSRKHSITQQVKLSKSTKFETKVQDKTKLSKPSTEYKPLLRKLPMRKANLISRDSANTMAKHRPIQRLSGIKDEDMDAFEGEFLETLQIPNYKGDGIEKRKPSKEVLNNILKNPKTSIEEKKRILNHINKKYLIWKRNKQLQKEDSSLSKAKEFQKMTTLPATRKNSMEGKENLSKDVRTTPTVQKGSIESTDGLSKVVQSKIKDRKDSTKSLPKVVEEDASVCKTDNSWTRILSAATVQSGLHTGSLQKNELPMNEGVIDKLPLQVRVPPTFRKPSIFAHLDPDNNLRSQCTQTNLEVELQTNNNRIAAESRFYNSIDVIHLNDQSSNIERIRRARSFSARSDGGRSLMPNYWYLTSDNTHYPDINVPRYELIEDYHPDERALRETWQNYYSHPGYFQRDVVRQDGYKGWFTTNHIQSEIPVVLSDDEETYTERRPATDVYMSQNHDIHDIKRYETIGTRKDDFKKGRRVTFFRNGDTHFRGLSVSINQSDFRNFETLLVFLNGKIPTTAGVRYVFSLPDGKQINSVTEFQQGRAYLASSIKRAITNLSYGYSRETDWATAKAPKDRFRKDENHLFNRPPSPTHSPTRKARVITVENNSRKEYKEKVIIDPHTKQNFEDILAIIGDLIHCNVHSLYTRRKPYKKIVSFSQLFREFKSHDMFIACQEGEEPNDRGSQQTDRSGSEKQRGIDDGSLSESPMENGFVTSRSDNDVEDDSVSVLINGKTRRYYPPSIEYADEGGKPDRKLKLEWIYGYHAKDSGNNLFVLFNGEVAYAVAAVVVLYKCTKPKQKDAERDKEESQRLYLGHTEEISSMALHPNKQWIASGQISGKENKAHIRVWDAKLLTTLNVIGVGFFDSGIISIDFSQQSNGSFIVVMDNADKHVLSIWDWQKERMVAKTTTTTLGVRAAVFYKYNDTILITYGQQHVYFWKLFWDPVREKEGRIMRDKRSGLFLGEIPSEVCSIAFSVKGDVLTGDSSGSVTVWSPDVDYIFTVNLDQSDHLRNAHKHPVTSLCMLMDNTLMTGGGLEIRAWDSISGYNPANARVLPEATGQIRAIVPQHSRSADGRLYIATSKGHVLDGSLQDKFKFLVQGHCEDIWAIAPHPDESSFFTTSFDKMVIKWKTNKHKIDWKVQLPRPGSCLSADLKGKRLAVGTQSGSIEILNAHNGMHVATVQVSDYRLDCIAFSPDGTRLAVGSHDGVIYIVRCREGQGYSEPAPLKGHPTFVTHIDWSGDSQFLQSTDGQYNMINWDAKSGQKIQNPRVLRDADWHSYTCNTGFPLIGPWTTMEPGTHMNTVYRSNFRDFILTGDSRGRIRLYKYNCSLNKPDYRSVKLYSSDVTAASFLYDDMYVVTAGGNSPVIAQWSIVDAFISS